MAGWLCFFLGAYCLISAKTVHTLFRFSENLENNLYISIYSEEIVIASAIYIFQQHNTLQSLSVSIIEVGQRW